jgi:hypothetical protein
MHSRNKETLAPWKSPRISSPSMNETVALIPSAATGRSRRLRASAAAAAIGVLLAVVLVAALSSTRSPAVLLSDGEYDGMFF